MSVFIKKEPTKARQSLSFEMRCKGLPASIANGTGALRGCVAVLQKDIRKAVTLREACGLPLFWCRAMRESEAESQTGGQDLSNVSLGGRSPSPKRVLKLQTSTQ